MFTGIVESTGKVISLKKKNSNLELGIETSIAKELKIGQSVAHNGVCLTVEKLSPFLRGSTRRGGGSYFVTAIKETLSKSNLGKLKVGDEINLERSLKIGDRLDGHFVQGHVDCTAEIKSIKKEKGSWLFEFSSQNSAPIAIGVRIQNLIIEKGSVCINGVSLTVVNSELRTANSELIFSVAIIPHTFKHTNFSSLKKGSEVNIEFDILGKHIFAQANPSYDGHKIISNK